MPDDHRQNYLAYLLRLWRTKDDDWPGWRASVESPHTAERHTFTDLEALFAFLRERTSSGDQPSQLRE